jgi:hypothetical protein
MGPLNIRPGDKLIKNYYYVLHQHSQLEIDHEGAVRRAFVDALARYGKRLEWTLVTEFPYRKLMVDRAGDTGKQQRFLRDHVANYADARERRLRGDRTNGAVYSE